MLADDNIQLSNAVYTALGAPGALGADFASFANDAAFTGGSAAGSTDAQAILYNLATGELYYNADGTTAGGLTLIGTFTGTPPALASGEFSII